MADSKEMILRCAREVTELERIVAETHAYLGENGVDAGITHVVDFAIEEMFVNMISYNTETASAIEISMVPVNGGVKVTMVDHNVDRFDPTEYEPVDIELESDRREPGGLGVFLTLKLVDSFHYDYRDRTSTITFIKRREDQRV